MVIKHIIKIGEFESQSYHLILSSHLSNASPTVDKTLPTEVGLIDSLFTLGISCWKWWLKWLTVGPTQYRTTLWIVLIQWEIRYLRWIHLEILFFSMCKSKSVILMVGQCLSCLDRMQCCSSFGQKKEYWYHAIVHRLKMTCSHPIVFVSCLRLWCYVQKWTPHAKLW